MAGDPEKRRAWERARNARRTEERRRARAQARAQAQAEARTPGTPNVWTAVTQFYRELDVQGEASDPDIVEEEPRVTTEQADLTHWARFTLPDVKFFTYYGSNYDRGQLMALVGGPRDEQLVRMGFVEVALKAQAHLRAQCGVCGCWFLTEQFRDMHGNLRHADRFAEDLQISGGMDGPDGGTALRDVTGDAEERRMQQQYPLYLEKTRATLESGGA